MAVKISSRGGYRPNSGKKKGQVNKLSAYQILDTLEKNLGKPYAEQLAENYVRCMMENDRPMIHAYDKLFLGKVVADKVDLDVALSEDLIEAKQAAFLATIEQLRNRDEE